MLKPEPKGERFNYPPRGLADVGVSENHVWSLLLHSHIFHLKNLEKRFEMFIYYYYNGAQKHEGFVGLKTLVPEQRLTSA